MRRCHVSCLPFEVVQKPNGLKEGVSHASPMHLATRLETRLSFIHSILQCTARERDRRVVAGTSDAKAW